MLSSLAKKTFDIYTSPARFAFRQGRKGLNLAVQMRSEFQQTQLDIDRLTEQTLKDAAHALGIDPERMSREEREVAARMALSRAEQGLAITLQELMRALILMTTKQGKEVSTKGPTELIEGEYERL